MTDRSYLPRVGNCSAHECEAPIWARTLCRKHYSRWRSHGDPNFAKFIPTPPGVQLSYLEKIQLDGEGCLIWPFFRNNQGYAIIGLSQKGKWKKALVSRLLCEKKNGPAPAKNSQAAHACGRGHKGCISPWHLSWKSPAENAADRLAHGTVLFGERNPASKITESDVRRIRSLDGVMSQREIGVLFGLNQTTVGMIIRRTRWAHVL